MNAVMGEVMGTVMGEAPVEETKDKRRGAACWRGVIHAYADFLPVTAATPIITLNEGNTPLIPLPWLSSRLGADVFLKYEGLNPTGSFKDRGMTVAVSKAVEAGSRMVMCASTGNTSASAAAYAARAGIACSVLIPGGKIALGKLAAAMIYGAQVIAVDGNFDEALRLVREMTSRHPITLVNSINPFRIEGQKTAAFEVCDALGDAPDYLAIPVGNAGNITAWWKGFRQYRERGLSRTLPRLLGFQAAGAAPIVEGRPIEHPETVATAIRIGNPASWQGAVAARDESGGLIDKVTDEQILEAYDLLASREGIFVEPASAAPVAGLLKLKEQGFAFRVASGEGGGRDRPVIVCVATGHGLKDPDRAVNAGRPPLSVRADLAAIEEAVLGAAGSDGTT